MADPLSITASIIAVLQLTSTVVRYIGDVKDSSHDRPKIRDEISSTSFLLYSLKDRIRDAESFQPDENKRQWLSSISSLGAPNGPLARFKADLEDLASRLEPSDGRRNIGKMLKWTFEKAYINGLLQSIERQKSIFTIALQSDHIDLSIYIRDDIKILDESLSLANLGIQANHLGMQNLQKEQHAFVEEGRRKQIFQWLAAPDPLINHDAASKKKQAGTGSWFLDGEALTAWRAGPRSFLWIFGIPGCGKTVLCSTIIEDTIRYCTAEQDRILAYFYFDFKEAAKQSHTQLLRSLIKQLSIASPLAYSALYDLYSQCLNGEQQPGSQALINTLQTMVTQLDIPTYIIVDALDECSDRELLLGLLEDIHAWDADDLHIITTSRPEKEIRETVEGIASDTIGLESALVEPDIRSYIRHTLEEDKRLRKWSSEVKDEVEVALAEGAHGMFRWVFCQLDDLKRCLKIGNLRKALKSLPKTLDETYARILYSIHEDYREDARRILRWLAYSTEPLSLEAVAEVLAITDDDFDPQNRLPDPADILTICSSLITVNWPEINNDQSSNPNTVQLAHFSVKEYLVSDRVLDIPGYNFEIATEGQQHLARDCIAYLVAVRQFDDPWEFKNKTYLVESKYPLLPHASKNWYKYCRGDILSTCAEKITKAFLTGDLLAYEAAFAFKSPDESVSDPLTFSCDVESVGLVKLLIREGTDVNSRKGYPLRFARDNDIIIRLLLDAGAEVDLVSGKEARTALQRAVDRGCISTMKLLIERGANINLNRDNGGGFALKYAALHPDQPTAIEILTFLLDHGADINLRDEQGTVLTAAIGARSTDVTRFLIDRGADLEAQDNCRRTPLALATVKGLDRIADALLAGGATMHPVRNCKKGERPLMQEAAYYGYEKLVKVFMKYGAEVNQSIFEAAVQGYLDLGDSQTTKCNWNGVLRRLMSAKPILDANQKSFKELIRTFRCTTAPQLFKYFSVEDHSLERWRKRHQTMFALIREAYNKPDLTCSVDELWRNGMIVRD